MDAHQQIAKRRTCDISAAVFGKGDDFVLVPFPMDARPNPPLEYAAKHDLPLCGILALIDGKCRARIQPGEDALSVVMDAVPSFAQYIRAKVPRAELLEIYQPLKWSELT